VKITVFQSGLNMYENIDAYAIIIFTQIVVNFILANARALDTRCGL